MTPEPTMDAVKVVGYVSMSAEMADDYVPVNLAGEIDLMFWHQTQYHPHRGDWMEIMLPIWRRERQHRQLVELITTAVPGKRPGKLHRVKHARSGRVGETNQ